MSAAKFLKFANLCLWDTEVLWAKRILFFKSDPHTAATLLLEMTAPLTFISSLFFSFSFKWVLVWVDAMTDVKPCCASLIGFMFLPLLSLSLSLSLLLLLLLLLLLYRVGRIFLSLSSSSLSLSFLSFLCEVEKRTVFCSVFSKGLLLYLSLFLIRRVSPFLRKSLFHSGANHNVKTTRKKRD